MSDKLKSCPFCGGEAHFKDSIFIDSNKNSLGNVHCGDCYASTGGDLQLYDEAIRRWNTRAAVGEGE